MLSLTKDTSTSPIVDHIKHRSINCAVNLTTAPVAVAVEVDVHVSVDVDVAVAVVVDVHVAVAVGKSKPSWLLCPLGTGFYFPS